MGASINEGVYSPAFEQSRKRLRLHEPGMISEAAGCYFDGHTGVFKLESFAVKFDISYPEGKVHFSNTSGIPELSWKLILLNYLSSAKNIPALNEWVSYRELPLGNVFFRSIETYVLGKLGEFFSQCDKDILEKALLKMGFRSMSYGKADLAAKGYFAPRIPLLLQFWEGEEGIPASCQMLFDRTISEHMHIEDVAALCGVLRDILMEQYGSFAKR